MKKILVVSMMALGVLNASAQAQKFGYVSVEKIIGVMPETAKADTTLQQYQNALLEQGNEYVVEYLAKDSAFKADTAKLNPIQKELKLKDLNTLLQKVQGWEQTMQQMMNEKERAIIVPLQAKALETIKAVAKEKGYTYIFDENSLYVSPEADDIFPLVKKKLGIKDPAPATKPAVQ